jgi:nucleoside-diphosphate-sugar epimerase
MRRSSECRSCSESAGDARLERSVASTSDVKALVTGANGFVGAHLVRELLACGWDVRAMMRRTSDRSRLEGLAPEVVHADLLDPSSLPAAVAGADVVFHVAGAIAAVDAAGFDQVNRDGTANLVSAIATAAAPPAHFVHVSSLAAAGPSGGETPVRDGAPARPVSAYGRSKLAAEGTLEPLDGRVAITIVRPPSVYGSGDSATLELYRSVQRRLILAQTGRERRMSFVHAHDLARGLRLAGERPPASRRVVYLTGPEDASLTEFQRRIARVLGVRAIEVPIPDAVLRLAGVAADALKRWTRFTHAFGRDKVAEGLERGWLVSNDLARRELGYDPKVGFEEGIEEALAWYRSHGWV